ncbi:hypothetical protein CLOSTMETH_00422 [[Clostridium] methylpentosum DSM 5476]|uniref:Uncharacterized protein n=1 Tax=[Clostridium] methylpentosum DSM 5476 TaxID=537013 RepID=C0E9C5_9FIRM|nr:hypothetical protein CLOSTMETH_00422 [[Clostridium] methylpentosum DSM 5476]
MFRAAPSRRNHDAAFFIFTQNSTFYITNFKKLCKVVILFFFSQY